MFRPQFLLFGDSLTQKSFSVGGWGARLANSYQRKADVVNRGFNGCNSRWALHLLDRVFPEENPDILLATIFFGANDAALPDRAAARQHVPLSEYIKNLRTTATHLQRLSVPAIVLIGPPPISEPDRIRDVKMKYGVELDLPDRTNAAAGQYSEACLAVAQEVGVPGLDLWTVFQEEQGWQRGLLDGGLHLTERGNRKLFSLLQQLINQEFPQLMPAAMADDAPDLSEIDPDDPEALFREFYQCKEVGGGQNPGSRHW